MSGTDMAWRRCAMFDNSRFTGPDARYDIDDTDDGLPPELDARWVHHCELAYRLDTEDLMAAVGDALSTSDVLRALIEDAKERPYLPGEARMHPSDAFRLGDEVARLIAAAIDDAVGLRMAVEVPHD
jgi:hypothetical protein